MFAWLQCAQYESYSPLGQVTHKEKRPTLRSKAGLATRTRARIEYREMGDPAIKDLFEREAALWTGKGPVKEPREL